MHANLRLLGVTRWKFVYFAILSSFCTTGARNLDAAWIKGDPSQLILAGNRYRENVGQIRTWRGKARVVDRSTSPSGGMDSESHVTFCYDAATKALRWNWTYGASSKTVGGVSRPFFMGMKRTNAILKPDSFTEFIESTDETGRRTGHAGISAKPRRGMFGPMSNAFDPMYYFTYRGEDVGKVYLGRAAQANAPGKSTWEITRDGSKVVLRSDDKGAQLINEYVADLAVGGCLVSYFASDRSGSERCTYNYAQVKGIWIPRRFQYHRHYAKDKDDLREIEWTENVLNEPIAAAELTIGALGLAPGDQIYDTRAGTTTTYLSPPTPRPARLAPASPSARWLILVAVNVGAALIIGGLIAVRLWRRKRP